MKSSMIGHVAEANQMIIMVTGHVAKDYVDYGNYCGFGGSGPVLDPIDEYVYWLFREDIYGDVMPTKF